MIKFSLGMVFFLTAILFATQVWALAPPAKIEEWNLNADLIVYGRVEKAMLQDEAPFFTLHILHVIKGVRTISRDATITVHTDPVPCAPSRPGLKKHTQGIRAVHVLPGNIVIAYLNQDDEGDYKPVLKGLSVIVTEPLKTQ